MHSRAMNSRKRHNLIKSQMLGRKTDPYTHILWREILKTREKKQMVNRDVITIGKHGIMEIRRDTEEIILEGEYIGTNAELIGIHNRKEYRRVLDEFGKWEGRMKESPLGKTEQDFVAFYQDVIDLFNEWFLRHESHSKE
jgi:hypothetical protein